MRNTKKRYNSLFRLTSVKGTFKKLIQPVERHECVEYKIQGSNKNCMNNFSLKHIEIVQEILTQAVWIPPAAGSLHD